jgi:predicted ATP-grasp superfamily ATP-dependent carboligase
MAILFSSVGKTLTLVIRNSMKDSIASNDVIAPTNSSIYVAEDYRNQAKRSIRYDALILDARQRQSLVSIRSLGQRGLRVAAMEVIINEKVKDSSRVPAFSSHWCQQSFVAPGYDQGLEPFLNYLKQVLDTWGISVLIPSSDTTLAVIRQYREELEQCVGIALAKEPALAIAINKKQTLEVANQLGIGVPKNIEVGNVEEVEDAVREIGLPLVIKPVESWLWGEQDGVRLVCKVVKTLEEAKWAVEGLTQFGGTTLFQPYLTGRRESVNLMYADDIIYARSAQWAKRTQPQLGGTSVYRQSIAIPQDIGEQSERLVREIDLEGYSEIEFRRDDAGKPYLMEINPRLSASIELAVRSGVDFPYLLYQWANGDRIDKVEKYRVGNWMRHLGGDITSTMESLIHSDTPGVVSPTRALLAFFASFFMPAGYDYFDWKDPIPAWEAIIDFAQFATKLLKRNISNRRS